MSNSPVPPSVAARVASADRSETSSPRPPLLKALEGHTKKKEYVPRRNFVWRENKEADCTRACPTTDCTCPPAEVNNNEPPKKHNKMQLRRRRHRHRHAPKAADDTHATLSKPEEPRSAVASPSPASPPDAEHDNKEDSTHYGFDTMQVHAGQILDQYAARTAPIYSSSTYEFKDALTAARLFALKEFGQIYGRITNPTNDVFERRMAALEGGVAAVSASSGLAAISQTMFTICEQGDNIVSSSSIYGGTYNQFNVTLRRLGIECRFSDGYTADAFRKLIDKNTKAVYVETIGNPGFNVPDFDGISKVCKEAGVPFIVDNTFGAGGYLFRPIEHGADIVIHSTTKWIGGHGNTIGGIVIDAGTFPWNNGRFPRFVEPSAGYHGLKFWETFGPEGALKTNVCFAVRFRVETMRDLGGCQNPFGSFLLLQGLETLSLRVQKQVASAKEIAEWLTKQPEVSWVSYLGLPSHPSYELAKKYMPRGMGSVFAFGIKGGLVAGAKFTDSIRLCSHAVSIGDVRTLVTHPATTTHAQLTEQEQIASGCLPDMIRVSIGIEDVEDLKRDIKQALEKAQVSNLQ